MAGQKATCLILSNENELRMAGGQIMEPLIKLCPRCKTHLQQADGAFELVRKGTGGVEPSLGVTVYSCPKCGYIELYNLKVLGRI